MKSLLGHIRIDIEINFNFCGNKVTEHHQEVELYINKLSCDINNLNIII